MNRLKHSAMTIGVALLTAGCGRSDAPVVPPSTPAKAPWSAAPAKAGVPRITYVTIDG